MTLVYRYSREAPPYGRGTFWSLNKQGAKELAEKEALLNDARFDEAEYRLRRWEDRFDLEDAVVIEDLIDRAQDHPGETADLFTSIRTRVSERAKVGAEWVQLVVRDEQLWHAGLLYIGTRPLGAEPAS